MWENVFFILNSDRFLTIIIILLSLLLLLLSLMRIGDNRVVLVILDLAVVTWTSLGKY